MKPSPMYWPHPNIGGVDQIRAHTSEAPTINTDRRLLLRRVMTKYRSIAIKVKQLIELRPAVAAENAYHWHPVQRTWESSINTSRVSLSWRNPTWRQGDKLAGNFPQWLLLQFPPFANSWYWVRLWAPAGRVWKLSEVYAVLHEATQIRFTKIRLRIESFMQKF
jgi:hypothetical protein